MMERENGADTIIKIILYHYPSTQGIYLFGSYQTDDEWPSSDVDIAILLPHDAAKRERLIAISDCRYRLEDVLKKEIDLLNVRLISTVFQFQIVSTGRLIHIGDEKAVHDFEMLTISLYQKLNEERRAILKEFYKTRRAYPV
jgi:predicted nucleotidyltransferase